VVGLGFIPIFAQNPARQGSEWSSQMSPKDGTHEEPDHRRRRWGRPKINKIKLGEIG